jgi:hypothetical protein
MRSQDGLQVNLIHPGSEGFGKHLRRVGMVQLHNFTELFVQRQRRHEKNLTVRKGQVEVVMVPG